jgi:hypothetical protein
MTELRFSGLNPTDGTHLLPRIVGTESLLLQPPPQLAGVAQHRSMSSRRQRTTPRCAAATLFDKGLERAEHRRTSRHTLPAESRADAAPDSEQRTPEGPPVACRRGRNQSPGAAASATPFAALAVAPESSLPPLPVRQSRGCDAFLPYSPPPRATGSWAGSERKDHRPAPDHGHAESTNFQPLSAFVMIPFTQSTGATQSPQRGKIS